VENEIFRLAVWANPSNEAKRGTDHVSTSEQNMFEVSSNSAQPLLNLIDIPYNSQTSWATAIRTAQKIDPAIAVYIAERFKSPTVQSEVGKLIRSSPLEFVDIPEALHFLVGDKLDSNIRRDLRV
jgi:phosphatidylinositol 4-kinase